MSSEEDEKSPPTWGVEMKTVKMTDLKCGKDHSKAKNIIWPVQLDLDLIQTLLRLCPDFFSACGAMDSLNMTNQSPAPADIHLINADFMSQSASASPQPNTSASADRRSDLQEEQGSQPNVQVDDSPLQPCMDKNKESLKVKLLLRRPMNQLVEQGILPPPKTPAAFAGQRVRLERARMGDLLKVKIQQRPARQELVRQHILEDTNARVAPSLAEKQRMLKRARLADSLNDHLIHRPGPLELVRKNILHAPDAQMEQAIKEGVVEFKPTCEGHIPGPHVPNIYLCCEDESSSDLSSPAETPDQSVLQTQGNTLFNNVAKKDDDVQIATAVVASPSPSIGSTDSTLSPMSVVEIAPAPPPPPPLPTSQPVLGRLQIYLQNIQAKPDATALLSSSAPNVVPATSAQLCQFSTGTSSNFSFSSIGANVQGQGITQINQFPQHSSSSKNRNSKKTGKAKSQPKARTIKFHEYKGPPSAHKGATQQASQQEESSYELLLQQQQLFLQWQLEWQHKYPQIILPAVTKLSPSNDATQQKLNSGNVPSASPSAFSTATAASLTFTRATPLSSIAPAPTSVAIQQSPKPHPIAPAPSLLTTATASNTIKIPVQATILKHTSTTEIKPKPSEGNGFESNVYNQQPTTSSSGSKLKLNDWKVSDLKAELKRRNLPVSGSKPQLVERLRQAESNLQDESVSTTTPLSKSAKDEMVNRTSSTVSPSTVVKVEMEEGLSPSDPMDISESSNNAEIINDTSIENSRLTGTKPNSGIKINNNSANNNTTTFITLPMGDNLKRINLTTSGLLNGHILSGNNDNEANQKIKVDGHVIRDQQKQIEQLQQALKNSQHQLQQMKSSQVGGGQKHRLALQQHLQQKMQQQALQNQLQKLIQLHSIQQQQKMFHVTQLSKPAATNFRPQEQTILKKAPEVYSENVEVTATISQMDQNQANSRALIPVSNSQVVDVQLPQLLPKIPSNVVEVATIPSKTAAPVALSRCEDGLQQSNTQIILNATTADTSVAVGTSDAFQVQANGADATDNSQENKWRDVNSATGTVNADHSWLLKINEVPCSERNEEPLKIVPEFIIISNKSEKESTPTKTSQPEVEKMEKQCFKSQMVDDVLEILIRNGELPPSAAQEPHLSATNKAEEHLCFSSESDGNSSSGMEKVAGVALSAGVVPPPPPLPPATFAVTLPTSMTFFRNLNSCTTSISPNNSMFVPLITSTMDNLPVQSPGTPSMLDILHDTPPSSSNSSFPVAPSNKATISKRSNIVFGHKKEPLSKEAADILKISKDLSNFGREHAESIQLAATNQNRISELFSSDKFRLHSNENEDVATADDGDSSLSLLLGEVDRELHLDDDMDVLEETSTSTFSADKNKKISELNINPMDTLVPMSIDNPNRTDSRKNDEYFLNELGILPADLDVPIPMEMDYSDWLENLLPNNCNSSAPLSSSISQQHHPLQLQLHQDSIMPHHLTSSGHQQSQAADNNCGNYLNNNELNVEGCNSFFGVSGLDYCTTMPNNQNHTSNQNQSPIQRDPLLSSTRTLGCFSASNVDTGGNLIVGSFGSLDSSGGNSGLVQDLKGNNGAPMSPMGDSLLWDFAM